MLLHCVRSRRHRARGRQSLGATSRKRKGVGGGERQGYHEVSQLSALARAAKKGPRFRPAWDHQNVFSHRRRQGRSGRQPPTRGLTSESEHEMAKQTLKHPRPQG
jgi:hypothetical protein